MARPLGKLAGTRIGSEQLSPQQALWRAMGLPEYGYIWRDPKRVSPQRLAELRAHDRHIKALEAATPPAQQPVLPVKNPANRNRQAARDELLREFSRLREAGRPVRLAAAAIGVTQRTGHRYEEARCRARDIPATCTCWWQFKERTGRWTITRPEPGCPVHAREATP